MVEYLQAIAITFGVGLAAGIAAVLFYYKAQGKSLAQMKRERILAKEQGREELERERRDAMLKIKDEIHKRRSDFELERKKSRIELQTLQHKYQKKEDTLERRESMLDELRNELQQKERELAKRFDRLSTDEVQLKRIYEELVLKLERVSGMTRDEATKVLTESLQEEVRFDNQKWIAKVEEETRIQSKERATDIICTAIQRYLTDQVTLHSSSVIQLPNEEMKGRIIGKEGRNIKALEMATGMEFVIGETPEIITVSGFNPVRREVAKRALHKLMQDGRINPTRIEETVAQCEEELDANIEEHGQQAVLEFGIGNIHPELVKLLGTLYFRTSYTQNNLVHSKEVAHFCRMIADELGLDGNIAARVGLLHDVGKAVSADVEGPHALVGADLLKKYGEAQVIVDAVACHHDDIPAKNIYGLFVQMGDSISASRPGARKETLSTYIKRLEQLEDISKGFDGVKKAYALQAGREIRVIVDDIALDDEKTAMLARDIANRIEETINFPGQIKVNVIREKRIIEYAK
ncbi:ribonuclease Y [Candidatus Dependentiae bacterium]|nr:ribonuclease Y [Candidatus Dependentiae bacterium]